MAGETTAGNGPTRREDRGTDSVHRSPLYATRSIDRQLLTHSRAASSPCPDENLVSTIASISHAICFANAIPDVVLPAHELSELNIVIVLQNRFWRRAISPVLILGIFLPPLYVFVMIQYGAITLPYWDHMATAKQIVQYFDGTLTLQSLLEPQSQARPLFPRLIFIANAALTNWDIRSEYIYIYLTVYGTFSALLVALWQLSRTWPKLYVLLAAFLLSVIAFSPVGATNHFFSLMLLATLSYLCAIIVMLAVSICPLSWTVNILAAALAWVSSYSISQGLFLFPILLFVHQLIAPKIFQLTRFSIFWLVNLIACYALYFPGLTANLSPPPRPALSDFLIFIPVYLGNPLGSLLWFPAMGVIWLPHTSIINGICGVFLLALTAFTAWRARPELAAKRPEALIFLAFAGYAGACAAATAWGRANGYYAIFSANSSRYSIFAACLLFGLIFYYAPKFARRELVFTAWHRVALGLFLTLSTVSYVRAIDVYKSAHDDNDWLKDVYGPHAEPTDQDIRAYPDLDYFRPKKVDLLRLGIGPYRSIPETTVAIYAPPYVTAIPLNPGVVVKQRIQLAHPMMRSLSFQIVTFGTTPSSYRIHWKLIGISSQAIIEKARF